MVAMPIVSPILVNPADRRPPVGARHAGAARRAAAAHGDGRACAAGTVARQRAARRPRRADAAGDIWIIEIKSSIEDFRVDRKWPEYRLFPTASSSPRIPACRPEIFPEECGFILSDGYGAEILRDAPEHRLAPATRKALMLRIARAGAPAAGGGTCGSVGAGGRGRERVDASACPHWPRKARSFRFSSLPFLIPLAA
jgi:hypothetical protein